MPFTYQRLSVNVLVFLESRRFAAQRGKLNGLRAAQSRCLPEPDRKGNNVKLRNKLPAAL